MLYDDDGNELFVYRTGIYHSDVMTKFVNDAESKLGTLIYDRKYFSKDFPDNSVGVHFEGLTEDEANTLDTMEFDILDKALPEPIGLRW